MVKRKKGHNYMPGYPKVTPMSDQQKRDEGGDGVVVDHGPNVPKSGARSGRGAQRRKRAHANPGGFVDRLQRGGKSFNAGEAPKRSRPRKMLAEERWHAACRARDAETSARVSAEIEARQRGLSTGTSDREGRRKELSRKASYERTKRQEYTAAKRTGRYWRDGSGGRIGENTGSRYKRSRTRTYPGPWSDGSRQNMGGTRSKKK